MNDKIRFLIPGRPEYLTMVRLAIDSLADVAGFDVDEAEDISTSVSEACKAVSCHGHEGFSEEYEIECLVSKGRLEINVTDLSRGHRIEKNCRPCRNCPKEGDLGIIIIKSLMTDISIVDNDDGMKSIKMVKEK